MKLKILPLIFILYAPFVNAVNLVCESDYRTHFNSYYGMDCSNGCERASDDSFSIIFDSNRIIEVTNFVVFRGKEFYNEEITPSVVYFELPAMSNLPNRGRVDILIERVLGGFTAFSYNAKGKSLDSYTGKCRISKKLF